MPKSHGTQFGVTVYFYVHACLGSILQPTTPHAKRTKWLYGQCPLNLWWWEMGVVLVMRLARSTRPTYFRVTCWMVGYFVEETITMHQKKSVHPRPLKWICAPFEVQVYNFWWNSHRSEALTQGTHGLQLLQTEAFDLRLRRWGSRGGRTPWLHRKRGKSMTFLLNEPFLAVGKTGEYLITKT